MIDHPEYILYVLTAGLVMAYNYEQLFSLRSIWFAIGIALSGLVHVILSHEDSKDRATMAEKKKNIVQKSEDPNRNHQQQIEDIASWYKWRMYDRKQLRMYWYVSFLLGAFFIVLQPLGRNQTIFITILNPVLAAFATGRYILTGRATMGGQLPDDSLPDS